MANHLTGIGRIGRVIEVQSGKLLDKRNSFSSGKFYPRPNNFRSTLEEKSNTTENNTVASSIYGDYDGNKSLELEELQRRSNFERETAEKRIRR